MTPHPGGSPRSGGQASTSESHGRDAAAGTATLVTRHRAGGHTVHGGSGHVLPFTDRGRLKADLLTSIAPGPHERTHLP